MKAIRFDDIEALRAEIGDGFGPWTEPAPVPQSAIDTFAELVGDHNWIHVDVERARRESPFGEPIAHGMLTLSLFSDIPDGRDFEVVGFGNSTNYGFDRVRFLAPVPAGSSLQASARLADVRAKDRGTLLVREVRVRLAEEDRLVFVARPLVLFMPPTLAASSSDRPLQTGKDAS